MGTLVVVAIIMYYCYHKGYKEGYNPGYKEGYKDGQRDLIVDRDSSYGKRT